MSDPPVENLHAKFEGLKTQLTGQHTAVLAALDETNALLGSIAVALGAPPPTATATLADVLEVLNNIHLDTISMDQKLLRIRDAINPLDEVLPVAEKTSMPWLLYRLVDAIQPAWPRETGIPAQPALDLLYGLMQLYMPDVALLQNAMGVPTGDATSTVLGRLSGLNAASINLVTSMGMSVGAPNTVLDKLGLLADCGCSAMVPNGSDCSAPYSATGMIVTPPLTVLGLGGALIFATFPDPPPVGITFGSTFGLSTDFSELIADDWTEWSVYVGSEATQYADQFNQVRYPTNSWRTMVGTGSRGFFVADSGSISVQLCRVVDRSIYVPPVAVCYTGSAESPTSGPGAGVYYLNFGTITELDSTAVEGSAVYQIPVYGLGDFNGWTIRTNIDISWHMNYSTTVTLAGGITTAFPAGVTSTVIYHHSPFTYELCPPGAIEGS